MLLKIVCTLSHGCAAPIGRHAAAFHLRYEQLVDAIAVHVDDFESKAANFEFVTRPLHAARLRQQWSLLGLRRFRTSNESRDPACGPNALWAHRCNPCSARIGIHCDSHSRHARRRGLRLRC